MGYKAAMTASISTSSRLQPLRRPKCLALLAGAFIALLLTGCAASLPKDVERPVSTALSQPQSTELGLFVSQARPARAKPDASAFALISGPRHALSSRMALVENAQKTLDLQYYAIHADQSTGRLLRAVVQAARRGVRVRVLLDDFHSTGPDAQVMRLAFVPNVEMRMFNPLAGSRASTIGRAWTLLTDFQRAQQRMHNKLFVADNTLAVIGGRNLGDAYFDASNVGNFVDLDVLAGGPVVKDLSRSFDRYWNNVRAYPVQSLISEPDLLKLKTQFDQEDAKTEAAPAPPASPNRSPKTVHESEPDPMDLGPGHGAGGQPDQDPRRRCGTIGRQRARRSSRAQGRRRLQPPPRPRRR
jgi:phosphatidylserine/phosphatidylglycerophosphate/cardiolipin synthase-like enzyme